LNTHLPTGLTMDSAAAHDSNRVLLSSARPLILSDSPLVEGPMMAKTLSSSISFLASEMAFSGLPPESLTRSSMG